MKKVLMLSLILTTGMVHAGPSLSKSQATVVDKDTIDLLIQSLQTDLRIIAGLPLTLIAQVDPTTGISFVANDTQDKQDASRRMSRLDMKVSIYVTAIKQGNKLVITALETNIATPNSINNNQRQQQLVSRIRNFLCNSQVKKYVGYKKIMMQDSGESVDCA